MLSNLRLRRRRFKSQWALNQTTPVSSKTHEIWFSWCWNPNFQGSNHLVKEWLGFTLTSSERVFRFHYHDPPKNQVVSHPWNNHKLWTSFWNDRCQPGFPVKARLFETTTHTQSIQERWKWDGIYGHTCTLDIFCLNKHNIPHTIHVWYIYLHFVDFHSKCRWIYQSHGCYGYKICIYMYDAYIKLGTAKNTPKSLM